MVATRFAVAVHLMMLLAGAGRGRAFGGRTASGHAMPATSGRLAIIVNTNPVVVRRIAGQLSRAGLIRVHRGPGGAELARPPEAITLEDIWQAVHAANHRPLVPLHAPGAALGGTGQAEASGAPVHAVLAAVFADAEAAFRAALGRVTLSAVVRHAVSAPAGPMHAELVPD